MIYSANVAHKVDFIQTPSLSFSVVDVSSERTDHPMDKISAAVNYLQNSRIQRGQAAYRILEGFDVEGIYDDILQSRPENILFDFVVTSEKEINLPDLATPNEKLSEIIRFMKNERKGNTLFVLKTSTQKSSSSHQKLHWASAIENLNPVSLLYTTVQNYLDQTYFLVILYIDEQSDDA